MELCWLLWIQTHIKLWSISKKYLSWQNLYCKNSMNGYENEKWKICRINFHFVSALPEFNLNQNFLESIVDICSVHVRHLLPSSTNDISPSMDDISPSIDDIQGYFAKKLSSARLAPWVKKPSYLEKQKMSWLPTFLPIF